MHVRLESLTYKKLNGIAFNGEPKAPARRIHRRLRLAVKRGMWTFQIAGGTERLHLSLEGLLDDGRTKAESREK